MSTEALRRSIQMKSKFNKSKTKVDKESLPSTQIQSQMMLMALYRLPQICETLSSLELPHKWDARQWALQQDQESDYLVDLYHFKEICRLLSLEDIKMVKVEFTGGLNLEQFVLLLLNIIRTPPRHIPFLVNGIHQLYKVITGKYKRTRISFDNFLNYYVVGQLISTTNNENDYIQMEGDQEVSDLRQFEALKKSKYGFTTANTQDVVHHDDSIKTVHFADEFSFIFSLDEQSDYFRVYHSTNLHLLRKIQTDSPRHKFKPVRLIDIYWSASWKTLGACCQDRSISFWQQPAFKSEYCYSCVTYGIQLKIYFIEITHSWITVNEHNQIIEWRFINSIDVAQQGLLEKIQAITRKTKKQNESTSSYNATSTNSNTTNNNNITHSSIVEGNIWGFKSTAKISFIKEIVSLKKLIIATFDRKITVWSPLKNAIFVTIDIPDGFSSAHTVAFSLKLNMIFSAGFDQSLLLWALDEVNQDYNRIGKIEVSDSGVSVSAVDCFDEYGLLVTIDESGMIRCWDIEKWRIAYRFNLGCRIANTISSIVRLEMGRFIIVTSRLHMFEFPFKQARKIKSKFEPLKQMTFNALKQHLTVASQSELFCFNINNAIVEHKYNLENSTIVPQMHYFVDCITQGTMYTIDDNGLLLWLDHKGDKANDFTQEFRFYKQCEQIVDKSDNTAVNLFELGVKICGLNYSPSYDMICVWSVDTVKVFKGTQCAATDLTTTNHTYLQVRQLHLQAVEVCQARCLPERDAIGVLLKGGVLLFRTFSTLKKLGSLSLTKTELIEFHFLTDFRVLIVLDCQLNLLFFAIKGQFKSFQCVLRVLSSSLFAENVLYKNASQHAFDQLNLHTQHHPLVQSLLNKFMEDQMLQQTAKFQEDLNRVNKDPFYNNEQSHSLLYKLKELEQQKRFIQQNFMHKEPARRSLRMIFKDSVQAVLRALKQQKNNNRTFMTQAASPATAKKYSLHSTFSYRESEKTSTSPEPQEEPINITNDEQYSFSLPHILEDFQAQNYLTLTNPRGQIILLALQDMLEDRFALFEGDYANKQIYSKVQATVPPQDLKDSLPLIPDTPLKQTGMHILHFNAHEKSDLIQTQLVTTEDKLYLFTFGCDDNLLKAWDCSTLRSSQKVHLDAAYLPTKANLVRMSQKLHDLQATQDTADKEVISTLKARCLALKIEVRSHITVQNVHTPTDLTPPCLEGEYLLPIETKIRWTLKDSNSAYRVDQMNETMQLLHKMLFRWQQANKHQQRVLELQINKQQIQYSQKSTKTPDFKIINTFAVPLLTRSPNQKKSKFFFSKPMQELTEIVQKSESVSMDQFPPISLDRIQLRKEDSVQHHTSHTIEDSKPSKQSKIKAPAIHLQKIQQEQKRTKLDVQLEADPYELLEEQVKTYRTKTIDLNRKFNDIYHPAQQRPQLLKQKDKKKRNKYEADTDKAPGDVTQNIRARSSDQMKYLMKYKFEDVSRDRLDSITSIIRQNRSTKIELNSCTRSSSGGDDEQPIKTKKNHYLNYFLSDLSKYPMTEKANDEYFTNLNDGVLQGNQPRYNFIRKMDQLLSLSKNMKNPNFKIQQQSSPDTPKIARKQK